jgi:hypothetical protein
MVPFLAWKSSQHEMGFGRSGYTFLIDLLENLMQKNIPTISSDFDQKVPN